MVEENSRNSLLNTLDKTPLLIGNICSLNKWEKLLKDVGKTGAKPLETAPKWPNLQGSRNQPLEARIGLSVDRPVDRQRSFFRPLGQRSTGRSTVARIQRAQLSARSTGAFPESRAIWTVDRVGRPALLPEQACTSVHVGRPPGRPTSDIGRPVGRPAEAWKQIFWDSKVGRFGLNKIP